MLSRLVLHAALVGSIGVDANGKNVQIRRSHGMSQSAPPLPALHLGLGGKVDVSISGISSGADFAVYFSIAHSAAVMGAGIFAGNAYRCYSTRFPGDDVVDCSMMRHYGGGSQNYSTAGCTNVDPHQAPCNTDDAATGTLPCPAGYGLPLSKCQGCAGEVSAKYVGNVNVTTLKRVAVSRAAAGKIDDLTNVKGGRYYLYRGGHDGCYSAASVEHAALLYTLLGGNVSFANSIVPSLHAIPTVNTGTPCGTEGNYTAEAPHGLESCDYDGPLHALQWIHGGVDGSNTLKASVQQDPAAFVRFDQSEFNGGRSGLDILRGGFAYIPQRCRANQHHGSTHNSSTSGGDGSEVGAGVGVVAGAAASPPPHIVQSPRCKVHVFAHGCGMAAFAGPAPYAFNDTYARRAGFNEVAEANDIVMLYPQLHYGDRATCASEADDCWDQGGSSGDSYSDKGGAQVKAVMAMVQKLL